MSVGVLRFDKTLTLAKFFFTMLVEEACEYGDD